MRRFVLVWSSVFCLTLAACSEKTSDLLAVADASVVADAGRPAVDAGSVDSGGLIIPTCPPGADFVELPLPEIYQGRGGITIFARPGGVTYENNPGIRDWSWAERRITNVGGGSLLATSDDAILYDGGRDAIFLEGERSHQFSGRDLNFTGERDALGQPYGAEFIQSNFVAWPTLQPEGVAVNIFDRVDRDYRVLEDVAYGPSVSATHVAWIAQDPTSMSQWRWVVENQETDERFVTGLAQHNDFPRSTSLRVTETEAYVFQRRSDARSVLHVWQFTQSPSPIEIPSNLFGSCQFLAGSESIMLCDGATGASLHVISPTQVSTLDTGGAFAVQGSQSMGRVLFIETDGFHQTADVQGRVVVLDTRTGERIELTDTFTIVDGSYLRTSFVDDVAVWSINNDNPSWGAVRLCP